MSLKAVDMAYNLLLNTKEGMSFKELWTNINNKFGYDEKIASRKINFIQILHWMEDLSCLKIMFGILNLAAVPGNRSQRR